MRYLLLAFSLLFLGCSSKEVFTPKKYSLKKLKTKQIYKEMRDYSKNTITVRELELKYDKHNKPYWVWVNYDLEGNKLNKFTKTSKDLAIYKDEVLLIKEHKIVKFPYLVFDVAKKGNLLAVIFQNNYYGVYDLKTKKFLFLNNSEEVLTGRYLHAKPKFYKDLILFPLLNGEVAIVDGNKFKYIRSIPVSDNSLDASIIFMKVFGDNLIIASSSKIINFNPLFLFTYNDNIKHVIVFDGKIVVLTIDGRVVFLDKKLKKLKTLTFKNADFLYPSVCNNKLWILTYNNYLISIDKNYSYKVYKLQNKLDKMYLIKLKGCKIYNADEVLSIE